MRTWKKLNGMLVGSAILVLASCVADAAAAWCGAVKKKPFSREGEGG
jgi:hypothetical protein